MKKNLLVLLSLSLLSTSTAFAQLPEGRYKPKQPEANERSIKEVKVSLKLNGSVYEVSIDGVKHCQFNPSYVGTKAQILACDAVYELKAYKDSNWLGQSYYYVGVREIQSKIILGDATAYTGTNSYELTPTEKYQMNPRHMDPGKI